MINREDSVLIARERLNRGADQKPAKPAGRARVTSDSSARDTTKARLNSTAPAPAKRVADNR